MRLLGMSFSAGVGLTVGLDDFERLFQPQWFYESTTIGLETPAHMFQALNPKCLGLWHLPALVPPLAKNSPLDESTRKVWR